MSTWESLEGNSKSLPYEAAELGMLAYYRAARPSNCWASNIDKFEEMTCKGEAGKMIQQFIDQFRSGMNPVRRRSLKPTSGVAAPEEGKGVLEAIEGAEPAVEEFFMLLRPDIIDFTKCEIYDVTTAKQAIAKTSKISGYAKLATAITGRKWKAEYTLRSPSLFRLHFRYRPGELICYGPTDLQKNPGVLAYEVIEDKKTKKEEKKKEKKEEKEKKASPSGGGGNFSFGISIMSTGGGSGNIGISVSILSNGQAYGTVGAGVVYMGWQSRRGSGRNSSSKQQQH